MNAGRINCDQQGYYITPFAPDGELLGTGFLHYSSLSSRWIDNCRGFLMAHGMVFRASWERQLQKIETKLTSEKGAGIGTFYVNGVPAVSTLYLSGSNEAADDQVANLFMESMQKVEFVRRAASTSEPFSAIRSIKDRPLTVVVVWGNAGISVEDFELVRELSNHFAAAFMLNLRLC